MLNPLLPRPSSSDGSAFHGWRYAAIAATMNFLAAGLYGRGFSVYFLPLLRDFGLNHTTTSFIAGLATLEGGVQAPIAGYLIDKYGPRIMTLIGATLAGIGFLLLPLASDLLSFGLIYVGIVSLGINSGFHNSAGAIVNAWFVRRRGLAFGIISAGIALGGGIMTPIVAAVVLEWGWRWAVTLSGLTILFVGVPLSLFIRNKPEDVGQHPDGQPLPRRLGRSTDTLSYRDFTFRQGARTVSYWLLAIGITLRISAQAGILVHIFPMLVWKGLDETVAIGTISLSTGGIAIGAISFSAVVTRLFMGWLGDKFPKRLLVVFGMIVGAAGAFFFLMAPGKLWVVIIFALMFSITDGAAGLTWAMIGDFFGRSAYATLRGLITFCVSIGSMTTAVVVGYIRDKTDGYYWALILLIGVYLSAALVFVVIQAPRRETRKVESSE